VCALGGKGQLVAREKQLMQIRPVKAGRLAQLRDVRDAQNTFLKAYKTLVSQPSEDTIYMNRSQAKGISDFMLC